MISDLIFCNFYLSYLLWLRVKCIEYLPLLTWKIFGIKIVSYSKNFLVAFCFSGILPFPRFSSTDMPHHYIRRLPTMLFNVICIFGPDFALRLKSRPDDWGCFHMQGLVNGYRIILALSLHHRDPLIVFRHSMDESESGILPFSPIKNVLQQICIVSPLVLVQQVWSTDF